MASSSRVLLSSFLIISLLLLRFAEATDGKIFVKAESVSYNDNKMDCGVACKDRCRLSRRPRLCQRACGTCCGRCNCVPPGTSGDPEFCPCYARLTTHGKRFKCP